MAFFWHLDARKDDEWREVFGFMSSVVWVERHLRSAGCILDDLDQAKTNHLAYGQQIPAMI